MGEADIDKLVGLTVEKLLQKGDPKMETIKMQVTFEDLYLTQHDKIQEANKQKEETKPALIKKPCEKTQEEPCPKLHDPEIVKELPCDKAQGDDKTVVADTARFRSLRSNGGKKVKCSGNKRL